MKEVTLHIKGMTCKSCEMLITEALEEKATIQEISAKKGIVKFSYNEKEYAFSTLKKAIEEEGFEVIK